MRRLALDVGDRRIGVAISDSLGMLASPLTTIRRRSEERDVRAVLDLAAEHDVGEIVVGMPFSLSGERGPQARQVERFRDALAARAGVVVTEQDERYSTAEAERLLREATRRRLRLRRLALDVGDRRIGVAISDSLGMLASPLTTIRRRSEERDVGVVLDLAAEHDVGEIVVGMPFSLSGERGPQARQVERFRDALAARAGVVVTEQDERYSTAEAERLLRETGARPSEDRARVDAAAAAVILQAYLDAGRARNPGAAP